MVFAAVESEAARELEPIYAALVPTISTARPHRMEPDVPLVIPGVNLDHLALVNEQRRRRGWKGYIATLPNCTATGLAITLKALDARFGVEATMVTTMQGISGAGRDLSALDIVENIIPYIPREEERVMLETRKILGRMAEGGIAELPLRVSATCTRAAVINGHTEAVAVSLKKAAGLDAVSEAFESFGREFTALGLPNFAPPHDNRPSRPDAPAAAPGPRRRARDDDFGRTDPRRRSPAQRSEVRTGDAQRCDGRGTRRGAARGIPAARRLPRVRRLSVLGGAAVVAGLKVR